MTDKPQPMEVAAKETDDQVGSLTAPSVQILRKRSEFLQVARGHRHGAKGLLLQGLARTNDQGYIGVGFTCSKKVGNAVRRNAAKRRLREVARLILPVHGQSGWNYVLVGRANETESRLFTELAADLQYCLRKIHAKASK